VAQHTLFHFPKNKLLTKDAEIDLNITFGIAMPTFAFVLIQKLKTLVLKYGLLFIVKLKVERLFLNEKSYFLLTPYSIFFLCSYNTVTKLFEANRRGINS